MLQCSPQGEGYQNWDHLHFLAELFLPINLLLVTTSDGFLVEEENKHYFHQMFLSFRRGNGVSILCSGPGLNIWHLSLIGACGKETACQRRRYKRLRLDPWVRKIPWRRAWQRTPLFLPGEYHRQRACRATVHRVAKSQTQLKWLSASIQTGMIPPRFLTSALGKFHVAKEYMFES